MSVNGGLADGGQCRTVNASEIGFYTTPAAELAERMVLRMRQFSLTVRCPPLTVHARYARLETAHAGTSPAPDVTATVAPFRAWRGSRVVVAEKPT
jgi:hypothetical protein